MDEITISVLGHQKKGIWEVIALEMDLVTSGKTFEKALDNLKILIEDQLSFASYKNQPDIAFKSAPVEYFSLYAQIKHDLMRRAVNNTIDESSDYFISGIPMPSAHVIAEMTNNFSPVNA
jgi:hypothetical protein